MASNKNRKSRWDEPKENDKSHKEKDDGLSCKSGNDSHCGISNKGNQVILGSKRRLEDNPEQQEKQSGSITIKMNKPQTQGEPLVQKKKVSLAAVFNDESDSEEEMPLECRMKMRNIGRCKIMLFTSLIC
ncbi:uncharacterized protein LOC130644883 isoform X2 [Hydractinia symbiolongicarpus]|uniref:uncharacterized protein LOC130644883 isoform X2 n=1 Tax=Hydractinia symbiolongicarpus TaxID=13093 RepID=UPI00254A2B0B|nr:uncharacterized protein LOC130644883 isoform X2 [Hydractinia symbiolongicarpus]